LIYDALVIGGGPAGGTSALLLARAGWSVAVVEKAEFPRRKVCGEFISATTLPLLDELGLTDAFLKSAGPPVRRVGFFAGNAVLSAPMPETAGGRERWGHALGREHLDSMLLDAAVRAGVRRWQPWTATEIGRKDGLYSCRIVADGKSEELVGRIVILANGSWERGPLPAAAPAHRASDLLGFKAHFQGSSLPDDLMPMLVFPGGYAGMVHTDGGRVSLSCCIRRDQLKRSREHAPGRSAGEAVLQHIEASCRGVREALVPARLDGPWLSAGPIRPGIRRRAADGLFFVGNLAGEAHPIIAEGISMAMQSAWLLTRRLIAAGPEAAGGSAAAEVGRAYAADWSNSFAFRLRASSLFANVLMRPGAGALAAPVVRKFPAILTLGARLAGKARSLRAA
jgi:flavin-dependent dehydrogenase